MTAQNAHKNKISLGSSVGAYELTKKDDVLVGWWLTKVGLTMVVPMVWIW